MLQLIFVLALISVQYCDSAPASAYQFLPQREGYVPVYIRFGDTPLNEINPELAIAFHENGIRARHIKTEKNQEIADAEDMEHAPYIITDVKSLPAVHQEMQENREEKIQKLAQKLNGQSEESMSKSSSEEEQLKKMVKRQAADPAASSSESNSKSSSSNEEKKSVAKRETADPAASSESDSKSVSSNEEKKVVVKRQATETDPAASSESNSKSSSSNEEKQVVRRQAPQSSESNQSSPSSESQQQP